MKGIILCKYRKKYIHMMKVKKIGAIAAAALITISALSSCSNAADGAGAAGGAATTGSTEGASGSGLADGGYEAAQEVVFIPPANAAVVRPGRKEESVYVKADASGNPTKTEVEVTLRDISGTDLIEDRSILRDVKNTKGDEEYSTTSDGRILWENHGDNIEYKGLSDEALPVDVNVTYYLDGVQIQPEQLAGKSGDVRIRFDYVNRAVQTNAENGREVHVPFLALSAVILPSDHFSNIEAENGKVLDMEDQSAVIGFALPGLMDSLRLTDYEPTEEIDLPEYVEITAHAEDFELDFTATVVTTGLFEDLEEKDLDDLEEMSDDMDELTDASGELADAAGEIADGGEEFKSYLEQYFEGVGKLAEGAGTLDLGMQQLQKNSGQLVKGSSELEKGLTQMDKALSAIDLSKFSSKENEKAAKAAAAAIRSLSQNTAALSTKLAGIQTTVSGVSGFVQEAQAYSDRVETLRAAAEELSGILGYDVTAGGGSAPGSGSGNSSGTGSGSDGAGILDLNDEEFNAYAEQINEYASNEAKTAADQAVKDACVKVSEAAGKAAADARTKAVAAACDAVKGAAENAAQQAAEQAAKGAVSEASSKAADTAIEGAREATASAVADAVDAAVSGSSILNDESLGLTQEQKDALKQELTEAVAGEIDGALDSVEVDTDEFSDVEVGEISLDEIEVNTDDIEDGDIDIDTSEIEAGEISVDVRKPLADVLNDWQNNAEKKLSAPLAELAEANENVGSLKIPDLTALSGKDEKDLNSILTQMEGSLKIIGEYGKGMSGMSSSIGKMTKSLGQMKKGVKALSKGSKGLSKGLTAFDKAISQTSKGTDQLSKALTEVSGLNGTLDSAFGQLVSGLGEFADGVSEFDEEGIQSLAELAGPEYLDVIRGLRAVQDAELSYNNYSGILDGQEGSVRFIIETEEIKNE